MLTLESRFNKYTRDRNEEDAKLNSLSLKFTNQQNEVQRFLDKSKLIITQNIELTEAIKNLTETKNPAPVHSSSTLYSSVVSKPPAPQLAAPNSVFAQK